MHIFRSILIIFTIYSQALFANEESLVLRARENAGMFSVFFDVLGILDFYENGSCSGFRVDFDNTGVYYDAEKGSNWWEYYFEPIAIGNVDENVRILDCQRCFLFAIQVEYSMTRKRANELIQKYVHVKEEISDIVEDFYSANFSKEYTIGVHYRGTDKITEIPLVRYIEVKNEIDKHFVQGCKIFVATDDERFLRFIKKNYGSAIIHQEIVRSNNSKPLHIEARDPYLRGKEALIDALLLSKTNLLIRTSSNLSLASSFFNPELPVIELSKRDPLVFTRL